MPKKILLIENDSAFAGDISRSLQASGCETRATGDGNEGLDLAREWSPDAIVLCVEMPGVSGYLVCQKLKKDEQLKSIPLVLTSAEATEETFEKHRTLKARADEYLLKPYEPAALLGKLAVLIGLPEVGAEDDHDEELVTLEEEVGLDAADGQPDAEIPGLDLQSLPDEPRAPARPEDDDFKLLDEAFDGLSRPAPEAAAALDLELAEKPVRSDEVDAAAASLPDEDEGAARTDLGGLGDDAERALGALGGADESLSPSPEPEPAARPVRGASADLLRAAGIEMLDEEPAPATPDEPAVPGEARPAPAGVDADLGLAAGGADRSEEIEELKRRNEELTRRADEAESEALKAKAQARQVQVDLEASQDESHRASERARDADAEIAELRRKLAEAEDEASRRAAEAQSAAEAAARIEALERELDETRTELLVARGEADGARGEVEKRTAELADRLAELEAANAKNEERIVKAYQKIKADEKIRDKVRKALAIAVQLLDEGAPPDQGAETERRAASQVGRE